MVYDVNGNVIATNARSGQIDRRTILHQGYHPQGVDGNSKSAFSLAYQNGFSIVEADVQRTTDGYFVMSHDSVNTTLEEWKTSSERITFEEFLQLIKKTNLEVYLDGKSYMGSYKQNVYDLIKHYSIFNNFTFTGTLSGMRAIDDGARCAALIGNLEMDLSGYSENTVLYCNYANVTQEEAQNAIDNGFVLELYTIAREAVLIDCFNNLPQASRWCTDNISVNAVLQNAL